MNIKRESFPAEDLQRFDARNCVVLNSGSPLLRVVSIHDRTSPCPECGFDGEKIKTVSFGRGIEEAGLSFHDRVEPGGI